MTVENGINKKRVQGDGVTVAIPFSFRILSEEDLKVYTINRTSFVAVLLTGGGVDYSVTLEEDGEGGGITLTTAPTSSYDVLLLNDLELIQPADLPTEGNFTEVAIENALDRSRLIDIQQQEEINRSLKLKSEDVLNTTSYGGLFIAAEATADRQDRVLTWNSAGTEIEAGPTVTEVSAAQGFAEDAEAAKTAAEAAQAAAEAAEATVEALLALEKAMRVVTAPGSVTITTTDRYIVINKTSGEATTVNLPAGYSGAIFTVKDGKGDADTNAITLDPNGAELIDGASTAVINRPYSARTFVWNGSAWNIIA